MNQNQNQNEYIPGREEHKPKLFPKFKTKVDIVLRINKSHLQLPNH